MLGPTVRSTAARGRTSRTVIVLALLAALTGSRHLLLLAAGTPATAVVDNVVSSRGARNRVFTASWSFTVDGREWRGRGTTARQIADGSSVGIRYLRAYPALNSADTNGALLFGAAVWIVPALLGVALAVRLR